MPRTLPVLLLAGALALSLAACGDDPATQPTGLSTSRPASPSASPSTSPSPVVSSPSPTPSVATSAVAVYYLGDGDARGPRLYREFHRRPTSDEPVRDAVEALLEGQPDDGDYRSLWAAGTGVHAVEVDDSPVVTVDLTAAAATPNGGEAEARATLQQLVHTVTAAEPSIRTVRLLIDGQPVSRFWGVVDASAPVGRAPAAEVLAPVWVLEPTEGATLARGDSFGGEASVFEATVNWEWVQDGTVVASGFSTAAEGAPGRGPWSATVDVPAGDYELRAFESSAEDGRPTYVDSKNVTVTG